MAKQDETKAAEPGTVQVRFLQDRKVKDAAGTVYKQGEVHALPADSANHFVSRGVAERVDEPTPQPKTLVSVAPPPEVAEGDDAGPTTDDKGAAKKQPAAVKEKHADHPQSQLVAEERPERQKPNALKSSDIKKG